jgi:hypothetical protein
MKRRLEVPYIFRVNHWLIVWSLANNNVQIGYQGYPMPPICDKGLALGAADADHLVEPYPLMVTPVSGSARLPLCANLPEESPACMLFSISFHN